METDAEQNEQLTIKRSLLTLAAFVVLQIIFNLGFHLIPKMSGISKMGLDSEISTLISGLCAGLTILLWIRFDIYRFGTNFSSQIGLSVPINLLKQSALLLLLAFLMTRVLVWVYRILILPYFGFEDVIGGGTQMLLYVQGTGSPLNFLGFLLLGLVVGPLVEELIFRGYLQSALAKCMPVWGAIATTSALFMVIHGPLILWPMYFLHSVLWGWAYAHTKSIKTAIAFHLLTNLYYLGIAVLGLDFLK